MRSAQELQSDLNRIQVLLHQDALLSVSSEERKRLLEDCLELIQKLDTVAENSGTSLSACQPPTK